MEKDINLLEAARKPVKEPEYEALVRKGSTILMVVYFLLMIGLFSFHFFLSYKEKKILTDANEKKERIKKFDEVEFLQTVIKKRLSATTKIFAKEEGKIGILESLQRVENLTGDQVTVSSFGISSFGNSASLKGSVSGIAELAQFFEKLLQAGGEKDGFDNLLVSDLRKSTEGYKFGLSLSISR